MPLCVHCGKPMACSQSTQHANPSVTEKGCALVKGAVWVHIMDDAGSAVEGVKVRVTSEKPTERSGFTHFDELDRALDGHAVSPAAFSRQALW